MEDCHKGEIDKKEMVQSIVVRFLELEMDEDERGSLYEHSDCRLLRYMGAQS